MLRILVFISCLVLPVISVPSQFGATERSQILTAHNNERGAANAGTGFNFNPANPVPFPALTDLVWDFGVANVTKQWADLCQVGGNQFMENFLATNYDSVANPHLRSIQHTVTSGFTGASLTDILDYYPNFGGRYQFCLGECNTTAVPASEQPDARCRAYTSIIRDDIIGFGAAVAACDELVDSDSVVVETNVTVVVFTYITNRQVVINSDDQEAYPIYSYDSNGGPAECPCQNGGTCPLNYACTSPIVPCTCRSALYSCLLCECTNCPGASPQCNGRGSCIATNADPLCDCQNSQGTDCEVATCDPPCDQGTCIYSGNLGDSNYCECDAGFLGDDCSQPTSVACDPPCVVGACEWDSQAQAGACNCSGTAFTGTDCGTPVCSPPCANGLCDWNGRPYCDCPRDGADEALFRGDRCETPVCPGDPECANVGTCVSSPGQAPSCDCQDGYEPDSYFGCVPLCDQNCSYPKGECVAPEECRCRTGVFKGATCASPVCLNDCSGNGECVSCGGSTCFPECECDDGWRGDDCSEEEPWPWWYWAIGAALLLALLLLICCCICACCCRSEETGTGVSMVVMGDSGYPAPSSEEYVEEYFEDWGD